MKFRACRSCEATLYFNNFLFQTWKKNYKFPEWPRHRSACRSRVRGALLRFSRGSSILRKKYTVDGSTLGRKMVFNSSCVSERFYGVLSCRLSCSANTLNQDPLINFIILNKMHLPVQLSSQFANYAHHTGTKYNRQHFPRLWWFFPWWKLRFIASDIPLYIQSPASAILVLWNEPRDLGR